MKNHFEITKKGKMNELVIYGELKKGKKQEIEEKLRDNGIIVVSEVFADIGKYLPESFITVFNRKHQDYVGG